MSAEELTGRTLGDFVVRHRIGEGGFGAVYRAEQPLLGREAVIKVLHGRHRSSKTAIQRFLREARLASKLDHPYAAHIYAFGVEPDNLMWIAMEYVKGQTLHEVVRSNGPLPLDELVPLLDRICEVLQAAHDLGIVHRDIKPPNVMVVQRSGSVFPKLLDFGVAKLAVDDREPSTSIPPPIAAAAAAVADTADVPAPAWQGGAVSEPARVATAAAPAGGADHTVSFIGVPGGALAGGLERRATLEPEDPGLTIARVPTSDASPGRSEDDAALTEAGASVGSPPYMAPEQWNDSSAATARTDLYALAITTYEALTGRRPFPGTLMTMLAVAHASAPVPPVGGNLPPAIDAVLERALAKQPDDRFPSVLAFAQAFRLAAGFGGDQPLPAFDDELRQSVEASFPQPIAEAVAAFRAARNPHQGREALGEVTTTALRYIAMLALAAQAQIRLSGASSSEKVAELLRELRRRALSDREWLELARELVAPFRAQPKTHPIPELVALLSAEGDADPLGPVAQAKPLDHDPLATIRLLLPAVTRVLRALTFLADYPLVVVADGRAESWMGVRRPRRVGLEISGRNLEPGQPALVDAASRPFLVLWPVVQASAPMPGAAPELFMLDGKGRRGAKLLALPQTLERHDERVWEWLAEQFAEHDRETPVSSGSFDGRPYRGLSAFTSHDASAFVGREREVDAAINRLKTSSLIAVVGPSGAGKSSLVHAGIVPSLPETWTTVSIRPGATPLVTLELRLRRAGFVVPGLAAKLAKDPGVLGEALAATETTTLLVIDQFEELFTLGASGDERRTYVRALLAAAQAPDDKIRIVLTLRDDFLSNATQMPELRDRLPASLFLLGTPARGELVRILTQPLARQGFDFDDPKLAERMVDDAIETPGALALLSFTASKLWELRDRHFRQLTRKSYDALGGVVGALAQHAEATLAALSPHEQRLARTALGHLVTAEGTRGVLTRSELDQLLHDPAATAVLEKLIAARLLVTTEAEAGDDRIEIIHEALLGAWPRLVEWRREDAEGSRLRDQVRAAARQWADRDKRRGLLWRDDALAELQVWRTRHPQPLTAMEELFVRASLAEGKRGRRLRRGAIATVIVVMAAAVAVLVWARGNARQAAQRDRARVVEELVERGRQAVIGGHATDARDAFAEAHKLGVADSPALRFLETMAAQPIQARLATLRGHTAAVNSAEYSPDGAHILTASADGSARLWNATSFALERTVEDCRGNLIGAEFDPTGKGFAAECDDGRIRLYRADGVLSHTLVAAGAPGAAPGERSTAQFSPDGSQLATLANEVLEVWDVASGERRWALAVDAPVCRVAFSPDGALLAGLSSTAPEVAWWRADTGRPVGGHRLDDVGWFRYLPAHSAVAFEPGGGRLATVAPNTSTVEIWNLATGERAARFDGRSGPISHVVISPDGDRLAFSTRDHGIQIWSLRTDQPERTLSTGLDQVIALQFTGGLLGAAMSDGSVDIWDASSGSKVVDLEGHRGAVFALGFDQSGQHAVTGGGDATAVVWNLRSAATAQILRVDGPVVDRDLRGDRLLTVTADEVTVWSLTEHIALARQRRTGGVDAKFVDDDRVALLDAEGRVSIWNWRTSEIREVARHHGAGDYVVSDGTSVASYSGRELIVSDVATARERFRWNAPATVTNLALLSDHRVAVADLEGAIAIIGSTGELATTIRAAGPVKLLAGTRDGRLVSASANTVQVWAPDGSLLHSFAHTSGEVSDFAVDHAGRRMVTTTFDSTARVWDLATYQQTAELPHPSDPRKPAFSPDDSLIATNSEEGIVWVWDAETGKQLVHFENPEGWGFVAVSAHAIIAIGSPVVVAHPW